MLKVDFSDSLVKSHTLIAMPRKDKYSEMSSQESVTEPMKQLGKRERSINV